MDKILDPVATATSLKKGSAALTIQPVILAGGSGTRLWPLSREHYPKQLIGLLGGSSLLESTLERLDGLSTTTSITPETLIICGEDHRFLTAEQLRRQNRHGRIVLEPVGRNTAPALTAAAIAATADQRDPVLVVMPADHAVADLDSFQNAVARAATYANDGAIVTLGIVPSRAETGYGYIKAGATLGDHGGHNLDSFVEKPHKELAEQYLASGEYWWNSGIFVVKASVWITAIQTFQPEIFAKVSEAFQKGKDDGDFYRLDKAAFAACPSDSIDYAVMEKLATEGSQVGAVVVPLNAGWSDVGSWDAVWDISAKDTDGNVARGRVMFEGSSSTFAHSDGRLIACVGLTDTIVVETPDAILVADKSQVQNVKAIVNRLKKNGDPEAQNHRKVHRPWGYYDSIDMGARFQVKRIVVKPGAKLSLQMHYHRAEHWIVVTGTAEVTCGDKVILLTENQSTYIPLGHTHRLANPGKTPLEIIEVQSGSYLGEDDIVRFDDTYGRV
jgi:mannose-1-phosphate guanylyltransferase/mannose-6-phosphate isomerase